MKRHSPYTLILIIVLTAATAVARINKEGPPQQWTTITIKNNSGSELFNIFFHYNKSPTDTNWVFPFYSSYRACGSLKPDGTATTAFAIDTATHVDYYEYSYKCSNQLIITKRIEQPFTVRDGSDTTIVLSIP